MKGKLIIIEGTDGSGKATQSKLLVDALEQRGKEVEYVDFPQYGKPSAAMIEEYLNGRLGTSDEVGPYRASVFYAVDRYAKSKDLHRWLNEGKIIICNRYVTASKGHQAGKIKDMKERKKFLDWLDNLEYSIFGIPKPDKVIMLHMPSEVGQKLVDKKGPRDYVGGKKKDIHEADLTHLKDAEDAYLGVAKDEGWTVITCAGAGKPLPIEVIHKKVLDALKEFF